MNEPRALKLRPDPVPSSLCPACGNCGYFFAPDGSGMRYARCVCIAGASWLSHGLEGTLVAEEDWEAVFGAETKRAGNGSAAIDSRKKEAHTEDGKRLRVTGSAHLIESTR